MASEYTWDAIDFLDEWGVQVQWVKGNLGFPLRKEPNEFDWSDEDGVQAFTDEADIQFAARDITLKCYIKGTTETNFHARLSAVRSSMCSTGLHDLGLKHDLNTHRVFYKAGDPVEILGGWNNSTNVGEFFLKCREPKPKYSAIWRNLVGHWLLDKPSRAWPGGDVQTKYASASQVEVISAISGNNDDIDFDTDTGWWTKETGDVTIDDAGSNLLQFTDNTSLYKSAAIFTIGKRYRFTHTVEATSNLSGDMTLRGGGSYGIATSITLDESVGTHNYEFTANGSASGWISLKVENYVSGTLKIENIALTQIGCVAQYEDTKTASLWTDASGNTLNAIVSGASLVVDPATLSSFGNVYSFDGTNDNIYKSDDSDVDMGISDFSFMGVVRTDTVAAGTDFIVYKKGGSTGYSIFRSGNDMGLAISGSNYVTTSNLIAANSWQAIAISADRDGNAQFYVNGVAAGTKSITGTSATNLDNASTLYMGKPSGGFDGYMDRILLFKDILTAADVRELSLGVKDEKLTNFPVLHEFATSPWTTDRKSTSNKATDFDGTDDYADADDPFQSTFRKSFSISLWCKPDDGQPVSDETIIGIKDGDSSVLINNRTDGTIDGLYNSEGNTITARTGSAAFSNGAETWHHVVMVIDDDSKQIYLYFDGVNKALSTTATLSGTLVGITMNDFTSTKNLFIGARNSDGTSTNFFAGPMADVRLYSKALSAEEVQLLYNTYGTGAGSFDTP